MAADVTFDKDLDLETMDFDLSVEHKNDVFSRFVSLRNEKVLCDVKIQVGSKEIVAHKFLLASAVPYFHSMFTHDLIESQQDTITLKDMDPESVETIIDFAYTSKLHINQKTVQKLLRVATLLQVVRVQEKCCEFLENQLHPSNSLGIFVFAEMHGCTSLKNRAKNFCDRNFNKVTREYEYLSLPFERVRWFLNQDELCVRSESEARDETIEFWLQTFAVMQDKVLDSVFRWINHDSDERKQRLVTLLGLVRLHLLTKTYLSKLVVDCEAIKSDLVAVNRISAVLKDIEKKNIPVTKRVPLGLEVIFCMGGYNKRSFASYDCFNPETGEWSHLGEMPKPKSGAGAVFVGGLLYIVGGQTNSSKDKNDPNTAQCYDPFTHEWKAVAKLNTPRHRLGVAAMDGFIYAVGGSDGMIHLDSVEQYDIEKNVWTSLPPMSTRRMGVGVAVLDGLLYAVGGFDSENRLRSVECYCPTENQWKHLAPLNTPRSGAGVTALNGHVYALGGYNGVAQLNSVERYCPLEDHWTLITPMNEHRSALSVAVIKNKLFALGGYNGEKFLDSVEFFDQDSGEWRLIKPMPDARSGAGVSVGTIPLP